jgi:hypothetical protein
MMVKVLIYSSKKIYDNASYEGRAEADFVAYQENGWYQIVKNRTGRYMGPYITSYVLERELDWMERDEFTKELKTCWKANLNQMKRHSY